MFVYLVQVAWCLCRKEHWLRWWQDIMEAACWLTAEREQTSNTQILLLIHHHRLFLHFHRNCKRLYQAVITFFAQCKRMHLKIFFWKESPVFLHCQYKRTGMEFSSHWYNLYYAFSWGSHQWSAGDFIVDGKCGTERANPDHRSERQIGRASCRERV